MPQDIEDQSPRRLPAKERLTRRWRIFRKEVAEFFQRIGKREILILGDSHAAIFARERTRQLFPGYFLKVVSVSGATASGLKNPNSKTQAYQKFRRAITRTKAHVAVIMLGEVDTAFVIWYRSKKYGESVADMLERTVETYTAFLTELGKLGFKVICISAPLPTIEDGKEWGPIANERREVTATHRERTDLALAFNLRIKGFAEQHGIDYLHLDPHALGEDRLVKKELVNADPLDLHYEYEPFIDLLASHVAEPIKRIATAA